MENTLYSSMCIYKAGVSKWIPYQVVQRYLELFRQRQCGIIGNRTFELRWPVQTIRGA